MNIDMPRVYKLVLYTKKLRKIEIAEHIFVELIGLDRIYSIQKVMELKTFGYVVLGVFSRDIAKTLSFEIIDYLFNYLKEKESDWNLELVEVAL